MFMNMNRIFTKISISVGFALFACAAAAFASSTILEFEGTGNQTSGDSITFSGTTLATFTSVPVNELVVFTPSMTMYTANAAFTYNPGPDTLTLAGTVSGLAGLSSSTTLETINLSSPPTASSLSTAANGAFSITSLSVSSVTLSSTLLTDLGLTGSTLGFTSFGDTGSQNGSTGVYYSTSLTSTVTANQAAAPEPVSLLLVSGGLIGLGAFRWRKAKKSR
jgi:hypothetical protein